MGKIIEYRAVMGDHPDQLTHCVNSLLKEGFQPLGGICATNKEDQPYVLQAMVKYQELSN